MTGYKKFVKKEKNRVKLKGNKLLPKGLNRTDTSFKVKKIVIKEQLKQHEQNELLSRKKLNVKELLSRLNHHNLGMRMGALSGLKQVIDYYPEETLKRHLSELFKATANLAIARESDIRKDGLKLLSSILNKVSVEEMLPLFPVLSSYLVCAMTHIDVPIREDSLKLLDSLLDTAPQLVASQADVLLPRFLDLVSQKSGKSRTLSLHLDGKISSEKWRTKVFYRLQKLLMTMADFNAKQDVHQFVHNLGDGKTFQWNKEIYLNIPLYSDIHFDSASLSICKLETSDSNQIKDSKLKIQKYSEVLIPLLLETFVEVAPYKNKDLSDSHEQHQISIEAAVLLQCIVDIILTLWEILHQLDKNDSMLQWFKQMYSNSICNILVNDRFPFSTSQLQAKSANKKRNKEVNMLLSAVEGSQVIDSECLMQNLSLCQIVLLVSHQNAKLRLVIINYLKNCLRSCGSLNPKQCSLLKNCLEAVCTTSIESESLPVLKTVIQLWSYYKALDKPFSCMIFEFLSEIALNYKLKHLLSETFFEEWLSSLPELLTHPKIAPSTIDKLSKISTRNIEAFSNSLDGYIETILDNIPVIEIQDCSEEESSFAKKKIMNLLYWVKDWDVEIVCNLGKAVTNLFFGPILTSYLVDIIKLRIQNDPEGEVAELICMQEWWQSINCNM